jgi:hypothetical protein
MEPWQPPTWASAWKTNTRTYGWSRARLPSGEARKERRRRDPAIYVLFFCILENRYSPYA